MNPTKAKERGYAMKLWLISQEVYKGYDTFDSAVVAAETEEEAKMIHPADGLPLDTERFWDGWADTADEVSCELLGEAKPGTESGVICASFNAG
jgi:hypothetical protein